MILMYHKVHPTKPTIWWVTVDDFYRQMYELQNYEVVYLDDYDVYNPKHVVITFDGIYKNVLEFAFPILKKFNYPFELFITSIHLGLDNEFDSVEPPAKFADITELKILEQGGGRIQWHTNSHKDLSIIFDENEIKKEIDIPSDINNFFPQKNNFNWIAFPYGRYNEFTIEYIKNKFKGGVSCIQGNDTDKYKLNRITVLNNTRFSNSKVSCIIACYNYGVFLPEAVESVLRQSYVPDEIIIIDDCSTDDTEEVAKLIIEKNKQIVFVKNDKNLGVVSTFNKAVSVSKSDYVVFLGADNRFQSNYIELCKNILDSNSKIAIAYTDYILFGKNAKSIYSSMPQQFKGKTIDEAFFYSNFPEYSSQVEILSTLKLKNFIHGSSMYRREAFEEVGGYILNKEQPEDYNLFYRIVKLGWQIKKVNMAFLEYRQHSEEQANIRFITNRELYFYKSKMKEYQAELKFVKNSIFWKFNPYFRFYELRKKVKKSLIYLKENGLFMLLKKIFDK